MKASPYLGKNFDPTGVREILKTNDDIWKADDIESEIARVNQELKGAGIDELVDAVNEQYGIQS